VNATTLVFIQPRQAVWQEETLSAPGEGELAIRTVVSLLSTGTEMTAYRGEFPREQSAWARYVKYPFRVGYSSVGEVLAVGAGVEGFGVGQMVYSGGSHGTAAVVRAARAIAVPDGVSPEDAAFASLSNIAMNGVRLGEVALGEAVLVVGQGPVGELATRYAYLAGAHPLVVMDASDTRLEMAERLGAGSALNPGHDDVRARLDDITRGRKLDVVFEVTGNPDVIPSLPPLIKRGGRLVLLGSPRGPSTVDFHDDVHTFGLKVIGAHASNHPSHETPFNQWTWQRNGELFFDLLRAGRVRVGELISHRFPWREAPEVFAMLDRDRTPTRGVLLDWRR